MQKIIKVESGNKADQKKLDDCLADGWEIKTTANQGQGFSFFKTCCLGFIFLPLALLGKKKDTMEYILEKEDKN